MTITKLPARNEYTANAGQTVFNYSFKIFKETDLNVYITPVGQDANDITDLITNYNVSSIGDEIGGKITLEVGTNVNELVTIVSNVPSDREVDYQNNGDFRPDVVNADFDKVVSITKKIEDSVNRTFILSQSQQGPSPLSLPAPKAAKLMRWKGDLSGLENVDVSELSPSLIGNDNVVFAFSTIDAAVNSTDTNLIADGKPLNIKELESDQGGDTTDWDVVLTSSVTPNGDDIRISVGLPTFSLVRRIKESGATIPFVLVITGQSNAAGSNTGGPNPANPKVRVWDGFTGAWGSSDYTQNPFARSTPDGNSSNSNIGLATAHRIQETTGRQVFVIYDAVGGKSITEWMDTGVSSTRYLALTTKVLAALATTELSAVTTVDMIHWQQLEEDFEETFQLYYSQFQTLIAQFRAEPWVIDTTPIMAGGPSALHERYEPKRAQRHFCNKNDAFTMWINSAGLETEGDLTHFSGDALWEMGYYRVYAAFVNAPNHDESEVTMFYGRGDGPAEPEEQTVICSFDSIVSYESKTDFAPINSVASTGAMSWGFECGADGNYTLAGGFECLTDNLSNYTMLWGRSLTSTSLGDYGAAFGNDNVLDAAYCFVAGRGNTVADEGGATVGTFSLYNAIEVDPVMFQVGIGTSSGARSNGITVRQSGTTEIYTPITAGDPVVKESITFKRVDNFTVRLTLLGTDSVLRTVDLTLA